MACVIVVSCSLRTVIVTQWEKGTTGLKESSRVLVVHEMKQGSTKGLECDIEFQKNFNLNYIGKK